VNNLTLMLILLNIEIAEQPVSVHAVAAATEDTDSPSSSLVTMEVTATPIRSAPTAMAGPRTLLHTVPELESGTQMLTNCCN